MPTFLRQCIGIGTTDAVRCAGDDGPWSICLDILTGPQEIDVETCTARARCLSTAAVSISSAQRSPEWSATNTSFLLHSFLSKCSTCPDPQQGFRGCKEPDQSREEYQDRLDGRAIPTFEQRQSHLLGVCMSLPRHRLLTIAKASIVQSNDACYVTSPGSEPNLLSAQAT